MSVREVGLQHHFLRRRLARVPVDRLLSEKVSALVADCVLPHNGVLHRAWVNVRFDLDKTIDEAQAARVL